MKIVGLEEFLKLPEDTVFMKYKPCAFEELCAKMKTLPHDFALCTLTTEVDSVSSDDMFNRLDEALEIGGSVKMDFHSNMRDGCFEKDQLFAIYEKEDVQGLINRLIECFVNGYPHKV